MAIDRRVTIGVSQVVGLSSLLAGKAGEDDPPEPHAATHQDGAPDTLDVTQLGGYPAAVTRAEGQPPLVLSADRTWQSPMPTLADQKVLAAPPGGGEADAVGLGEHLSIDQGQLLVTGNWTASYVIQQQPIAHQLARKAKSAELDYGTQPEYLPNAIVLSELPTGYLRNETGTGTLTPVAGSVLAAPGAPTALILGTGLAVQGNALVATAKDSSVYGYGFSTATTEPPAARTVRLNAGYPYTAVTKVWVTAQNTNREDLYFLWMDLGVGARVVVQQKDTHGQYADLTVTGPALDKSTHIEIPVAWKANGTALVTGDCLVRTTDTGALLAQVATLEARVTALTLDLAALTRRLARLAQTPKGKGKTR